MLYIMPQQMYLSTGKVKKSQQLNQNSKSMQTTLRRVVNTANNKHIQVATANVAMHCKHCNVYLYVCCLCMTYNKSYNNNNNNKKKVKKEKKEKESCNTDLMRLLWHEIRFAHSNVNQCSCVRKSNCHFSNANNLRGPLFPFNRINDTLLLSHHSRHRVAWRMRIAATAFLCACMPCRYVNPLLNTFGD